ncbi:secreted DNA-specific endonuclease I with Por secretion system C-terminal sorting domain [Psychroflexus torquis ATCC 700755]|uniref:Secreted DNA-specific endonuclease I with Por secretion system C-terminal sorting domain n=1 Tax=Psychroflexus torquis (strain ATCC 700755 / CIP 106069 / ACAM 623) TaxID=313595 RepID=K4II75_PSYTT|nr:endonuclease [Psychroflexus torquis]AFU70267.1 secreted DNA-specific endonuclease I with Por secretion system C-terminal sorting domain [Psychroflexus torquis ATCC 700755]
MNKITFLVFCLLSQFIFSQKVIINEVDSDTPGVDTQEFIELRTQVVESPLDGYVLVFFNGSSSGADSSYFAMSLDGFVTDFNGLFVVGGPELTPSPNYRLLRNFIQNGADAVAVYKGSVEDFEEGTLATIDNLVDALVYGTSDPEDQNLLNLLLQTEQIDEDVNGNSDSESMQRNFDGSWFVSAPTPRIPNDGSGITPVFIDVTTSSNLVNEGDSFTIDFETSEPLMEEIMITFSLINGGFTEEDYTGQTSVTLSAGTNSGSVAINLVDDEVDEGDEFISIAVDILGEPYILNSNFIQVIAIDDDFTIADWGTPIHPTFDKVEPTGPSDYFESLNGESGPNLSQAIQDIIAEEGVVKIHTYSDIIDILKSADQSPMNSNEVWLAYREESRPKYLYQLSSSGTGFWNREHVYPRSRGGFFSIEDDEIATGINEWWVTNADSLRHANSDAHGLRATDANENSSRGNQHFGEYIGPEGTLGSFRGDVARAVFYLSIRFNDLSVVDGFPDSTGQLGDLQTLLQWHLDDPVDDFEMNRNNIAYTWQNNRNPFIDYPELASYLWGNNQGEVWNQSLSVTQNMTEEMLIYPNPASNYIQLQGILKDSLIQMYSMTGKKVLETKVNSGDRIALELSAGVYLVRVMCNSKVMTKKLIIN